MDSLGHGPSNLVLDAPSIGLDAPLLWPRRSSLSPRHSWFGFGCSCLGFCHSCEVVLGPLPSEMVDIPCIGRKYTWYRPNGKAKSRLDRFLTTFEWLQHWSGNKQYVLDRQISDHCGLVLKSNMVDWGPKPFRFLDIW